MRVPLRAVNINKDADNLQRLSARDFGRVLALTGPYKRTLLTGMLLTVIFASLHTLGIATAFPVFKILLDDEGIKGWANRSIAGERIGVDFAPVKQMEALVVLGVSSSRWGDESDSSPALQPGDTLNVFSPADKAVSPTEQLAQLAETQAGVEVTIFRGSRGGDVIRATTTALDWKSRTLAWCVEQFPGDTSSSEGRFKALIWILGGLVTLVFIGNIFRYIGEVKINTAVLRSLMDLRAQLYERVLQLPMSYFSGQTTSDVVTRFVQDVQEIQRGLMTFYGKCIREPLKAALVLALAFALDWRITLTLVVVVPITLAIFFGVGRKVKKANRRLLRGYSLMIDALTASLQSLPVVKVYTAEEHERRRLASVDEHMFRQQLKLARLQAFVSPMIETLAVIAAGFATVWLAAKVLGGTLPIATFGTLGIALAMLFDPLRKLTDVYVRIQRSTVGAERIFQVLGAPIEKDANTSHQAAETLREAIEFRNVSFTYAGGEKAALKDVNLTITKGETLAVIGPNGCGKTTLVSMIPRLQSPEQGEILYDGTPLPAFDLKSLRSQISVVSQDAVIFSGTPGFNIAYGVQDPDRELIERAAIRAHAGEFIESLPGGFEAALAERGTSLSGGQRQRISIARAIYRDAPILIFDEATSQIDSESEQKIQEALKEFAKDRTTIVIAHRLSTIQFADRIVVMDDGKVIDSGKHAELLKRCEFYRRFCETQFGVADSTEKASVSG